MEYPTWKFIFFAAILFQMALSAPPGPPMDFESGWEEGPRSAAGNNEDLATLITNFLGGQGSSGSNPQDNSGHHNHGWEQIPNPDPPTPTEAYNPVPVAEEPVVDEPVEVVTDVTIGCRLAAPVQLAGSCGASNCLEDSAGLCVCPRTQLDCSDAEDTKQCVWLDTTKPGEPKSGKCIHKTEAIYNALFKKLSSRGKKSLALSIYYHSKPAQGRAPYGPHGPYIIDAVGHYLQKGYGARSYGSYQTPSYGGYDSYNSYDSYKPPSHYGHDSYEKPPYGGYESDYGYDSYKEPSYGYNSHYGYDSYKQPSYDSYKPPSYGYDSYKPPYNEYEKPYEKPYEPKYEDKPSEPKYEDKPYEPKYEQKPYNDYEKPHYENPYEQKYEPKPYEPKYEPKPYNEYEKPSYEKPYEHKYEPKPYNDYETPHYDSYEPYDYYPKPKYEYNQEYSYPPPQYEYGYEQPKYEEYGGGYNHYEKPYGGYEMNHYQKPYGGYETYKKPVYGYKPYEPIYEAPRYEKPYERKEYKKEEYKKPEYDPKGKYDGQPMEH